MMSAQFLLANALETYQLLPPYSGPCLWCCVDVMFLCTCWPHWNSCLHWHLCLCFGKTLVVTGSKDNTVSCDVWNWKLCWLTLTFLFVVSFDNPHCCRVHSCAAFPIFWVWPFVHRWGYGMLKEKAVLALAKAIWELLVLLPSQRKQRTFLLVAAGLLFSLYVIFVCLKWHQNCYSEIRLSFC